jgi:hypothetical protein
MSDANPNALRAPNETSPPRLILEFGPSGQIIAEAYLNGQRQRLPLNQGSEWWEIQDIFARLRRDRLRQAALWAEKKEREVLSRHRRVWTGVAIDHGTSFANRTVGQRNSLTRAPNASRPKATTIASTIDLL